jgi:hypothetical protein
MAFCIKNTGNNNIQGFRFGFRLKAESLTCCKMLNTT